MFIEPDFQGTLRVLEETFLLELRCAPLEQKTFFNKGYKHLAALRPEVTDVAY